MSAAGSRESLESPEAVLRHLDERPEAFCRVPGATYRLQLDPALGFAAARDLVPYLAALGVSDCYLSPFLQPASGRSHGYDVADHGRLNEALGTEDDYRAFAGALEAHGMGQVVDVVPNHMGIGSRNGWWMDVLENGPASPYAAHFDIDWEPLKPELKNKVLLPILGDQYGRVLERQELVLEFHQGAFAVRYHDTLLPVAPRTYVQILGHRLEELAAAVGEEHSGLVELRSIMTALAHLPPQTETDPERLAERNREKQVAKRRLAALAEADPRVRGFVEENIRVFNGTKGEPVSFDLLDRLLAAQAYRLAFWQVAADEINYRRFFDINELAALRMEDPRVFEEAHRLLLRFVREGWVTGLRIDHPDGLYAPRQYFQALQRRCFLEVSRRLAGEGAGAAAGWEEAVLAGWDRRAAADPSGAAARTFYVVAEKIVLKGERLPETWPVHGTTGYEFLNALNGLFVNPGSARAFEDIYARFVGGRVDLGDVIYESKKLIMDTSMASELALLGHRLARISGRYRSSRDFSDRSLAAALREIIACFPVYRAYIGEDGLQVSERDRRFVERAVGLARRLNPTTSASLFDFIRDVLCLRFPGAATEADRAEQLTFVQKLQQLTAPIMAKGLEDTAFYRYNRLTSLNEVGGDPGRFGIPVAEFHALQVERQRRWPGSLSATATHDGKRGEDVRARINVLSEIPQEWRVRVRTWRRLNRRRKRAVDGLPAPDKNEEYLLYQTLVGAWPIEPTDPAEHAEFTERIQQYMYKALREAKVHVSWVNPHAEYDAAVQRFVGAVLDRSAPNPFLDDLLPFQRKVSRWGMYNSLAQTVVKLTAPGVPDLYQGTELWDLSLVDPDNRRPVDYPRRRHMLDDLARRIGEAEPDLAALAGELLAAKEDGRIKLYVIHRALGCRRRRPHLFRAGEYQALEAYGPRREHLCAFARRAGAEWALTVVPRFVARLAGEGPVLGRDVWGDTRVGVPADGPARFRNLFTGEVLQAGEWEGRRALPAEAVLRAFPVAVLEGEPEGGR